MELEIHLEEWDFGMKVWKENWIRDRGLWNNDIWGSWVFEISFFVCDISIGAAGHFLTKDESQVDPFLLADVEPLV